MVCLKLLAQSNTTTSNETSDRALQERLLARRVLHYNSRQMYYECNHGIVAEDGSRNENRYHGDVGNRKDSSSPLKSSTHEESVRDASLDDWAALVWTYGPRELSRPTDKLPACESILARSLLIIQRDSWHY